MSATGKIKTFGLMAASALAGAGAMLGIKSLHDNEEKQTMGPADDSADLKRQIAENRAKMAEISSDLGKSNPTGHFRQSVRGAGAGVDSNEPNVSQPEFLG